MMVTDVHCASLLPDDRRPALTCPTCIQDSRPITSINLSPMDWTAVDRSTEGKESMDEREGSLVKRKCDFLLWWWRLWLLWRRSWTLLFREMCRVKSWLRFSLLFFEVSPQRLEPPYILGMLRRATPCKDGPDFKSRGVPSQIISISSWRFLQVAKKVSEVANSRYQILFLTRELNFSGCFSLSRWNRMAIEASLCETWAQILW